MAQWKQYSGVWTRQAQMQAAGAQTWPGVYLGDGLFSWGYSAFGTLGQGNSATNKSSPTQVGTLNTWLNVASIGYNGFAIKTDGTMWSWGNNTAGVLGLGNTTTVSSPVQIGALTTWAFVTSDGTSAAIKTDGTLWAWGDNFYGQIGDGTQINRSSPVQIGSLTNWSSVQVCGVVSASIAIKTNGSLWAWGNNGSGQLGQNNIIYRSSPVQVGSGTTWFSVGIYYSVAATKTDGTLWTWGSNDYGQLGQNIATTIRRSSPVQVGLLTNWSKVAVDRYNVLSVKTDGTLWSWGRNTYGTVGDGTTVDRSSPVQIGLATDWNLISVGCYNSAATKTNGTLWTWGISGFGQLGNGDATINKSSPIQVGSAAGWTSIAMSYRAAFGLQKQYTPG